ncbi:MAG: hypothetical protein QGH45_24120 [Myxococcota bacterium]|nr:hypothetical protein [Myxococcota bacterium]
MRRFAAVAWIGLVFGGCVLGFQPTNLPGGNVHIGDMGVECNPEATAAGDQLVFEAYTSGQVRAVNVTVLRGQQEIVSIDLVRLEPGYWEGKLRCSDIESDCGEFDALLFKFSAEGVDGSSENKLI